MRARIGVRSVFNKKLGDLHLPEGAERQLRNALVGELQSAGFTVSDSQAGVRVTLRLNKVWLHSENTILYWDIIGEIDCDLRGEVDLPRLPNPSRAARGAMLADRARAGRAPMQVEPPRN